MPRNSTFWHLLLEYLKNIKVPEEFEKEFIKFIFNSKTYYWEKDKDLLELEKNLNNYKHFVRRLKDGRESDRS